MLKFISRLKKEIEYGALKDWTLSDTGAFWDSVLDYDDINGETYSYYRRFTDSFKLAPTLPDNSDFLDICCRSGNGTLFYRKHGKVGKAVCADLSVSMLERCKTHLAAENVVFEAVVLKSYDLPFRACEFNIILSLETVEHLSKPAIFIKELSRCAKGGGIIILSTPNVLWEWVHSLAAISGIHHSEGPHRFIRRRALIEYIKDAGLDIEVEDAFVLIPGGPKFLVRAGEFLERLIGKRLRRLLCLRRIFVCRKI